MKSSLELIRQWELLQRQHLRLVCSEASLEVKLGAYKAVGARTEAALKVGRMHQKMQNLLASVTGTYGTSDFCLN